MVPFPIVFRTKGGEFDNYLMRDKFDDGPLLPGEIDDTEDSFGLGTRYIYDTIGLSIIASPPVFMNQIWQYYADSTPYNTTNYCWNKWAGNQTQFFQRRIDGQNFITLMLLNGRVYFRQYLAGDVTVLVTSLPFMAVDSHYLYQWDLIGDQTRVQLVWTDDPAEPTFDSGWKTISEDIDGTTTGIYDPGDPVTSAMSVHAYGAPSGAIVHLRGLPAGAAYGDPGIWWHDGDDNPLQNPGAGCGLFTDTTLVRGTNIYTGLDSNHSGICLSPRGRTSSTKFEFDDTVNVMAAALDDRIKALQIQRSADGPNMGLVHESGKRWKLLWPESETGFNDPAIYPAFQGYGHSGFCQEMALCDFSEDARFAQDDFSGLVDSKSAPATNALFDHDQAAHVQFTVTYEAGKYVIVNVHFVDSSNRFYVYYAPSGYLAVAEKSGGDLTTLLQTAAGYLADGIEYVADLYWDLDGNVSMFLDGDLEYSGEGVMTIQPEDTGGKVQHDLATNDLELEVHPVALGACRANVICPQDGEVIAAAAPPDLALEVADVTLPAAAYTHTFFRGTVHDEEPYCYGLRWYHDGSLAIREYPAGTGRIVAGAGTVSGGDTMRVVCHGASMRVYVNKTFIDSYESAIYQDNIGVKQYNVAADGPIGSVKVWDGYINLPLAA